jgi:hypothetical protein
LVAGRAEAGAVIAASGSSEIDPLRITVRSLSTAADAGVERVFVWPVSDEVAQLEKFGRLVLPRLS